MEIPLIFIYFLTLFVVLIQADPEAGVKGTKQNEKQGVRMKRENKEDVLIEVLNSTKPDSTHETEHGRKFKLNGVDAHLVKPKDEATPKPLENLKTTTDPKPEFKNRRLMNSFQRESSDIKKKVLDHINETLNELSNKIESLRPLKEFFQNDVNYKIGYIVANIDNLNVNMKKLQQDLDLNRSFWDDAKISYVFDSVKASNKATQSLLDALNLYSQPEINRVKHFK